MNKFLLISLLLVFWTSSFAQTFTHESSFEKFQSSENQYYWKNKKPYDGYWQQDVFYSIRASLDDSTDIINAKMVLRYINNSPDTLKELFFHLYQNAFQPDSYFAKRSKAQNYNRKYGNYEKQKLGTEISELKVDGKSCKTELDNTILKVFLNKPITPNSEAEIEISFKTYFQLFGDWRRMKVFLTEKGNKHYNGVHWYPRICVYDRKFGWTTDQHLGKEFYGDFGVFHVELELPQKYIVEATGNLVNRNEAMPDELLVKIDINNFKNPSEESTDFFLDAEKSKTKKWIFHAENVHDFAWTADPDYRIEKIEWNGIEIISLAREKNAHKWQDAAETAKKVMEIYTQDVGPYPYPKIIVADAEQGMEYPMITLDSGSDPNHYLFAHEIGHQWFFAMVGSNETYRGVLDEGFTQFLTTFALDKFAEKGEHYQVFKDSIKAEEFLKNHELRLEKNYSSYIKKALRKTDTPLNYKSDSYHNWPEYRIVYDKGTTMLWNLEYVLGSDLFWNAMQNYFQQWSFCHPYVEDMRNSFIQFTGVDLNWFFDDWLETTRSIDYSVKSVKKNTEKYEITLERIGDMSMPIDFSVYTKSGKELKYHIPNSWFEKKTDAEILPRWIGWSDLNSTYTANISINDKIKKVVIDPSLRLADVNRLNNSNKYPITFNINKGEEFKSSWENYVVNESIELKYNALDGIKAGINLHGNYLDYNHILYLSLTGNTRLFQQKKLLDGMKPDIFDWSFYYKNGINNILPTTDFYLQSSKSDGLLLCRIGAKKSFNRSKRSIQLEFKSMRRNSLNDKKYLIYEDWKHAETNSTFRIHFMQNDFNFLKNSTLRINLISSILSSNYNYSYLNFEILNTQNNRKFDLKTRIFAQYGFGKNWAPESKLYLFGANPEQMMNNSLTKAKTIFPHDWYGIGSKPNHIHSPGGLNLRAYSGYLVYEKIDGEVMPLYSGNTGASVSTELNIQKLLGMKHRQVLKSFNPYLFFDGGIINTNKTSEDLQFSDFYCDAGFGIIFNPEVSFNRADFGKYLSISFDIPLFMNRPPINEEYFDFRYLVSIRKEF